MKSECRGYSYYLTFFCLLLAAALFLAGCTNPEKAKAQHVARGETYLKDSKFQEASLEFRNATQIDDNFIAAHWGLARAFEGLERFPEMLDELRKTPGIRGCIRKPFTPETVRDVVSAILAEVAHVG